MSRRHESVFDDSDGSAELDELDRKFVVCCSSGQGVLQ